MTTIDSKRPYLRRRWRIPALMTGLGVAIFIAIAADVTHNGLLVQADQVVAPFIYEHANGTLVFFAACVSGLGEFKIVAPFAVIVGLVLAARRQWRAMSVWALGLIGSGLICDRLKYFFAVPRPTRYLSYVFEEHPGFSFPSGHTMGVVVTAGLLVLVLRHLKERTLRTRLLMAAVLVGLALLEAAALVYVGVHYVTDVLGGMAVSVAWLGVLRWLLPPAESKREVAKHAKGHEGI